MIPVYKMRQFLLTILPGFSSLFILSSPHVDYLLHKQRRYGAFCCPGITFPLGAALRPVAKSQTDLNLSLVQHQVCSTLFYFHFHYVS